MPTDETNLYPEPYCKHCGSDYSALTFNGTIIWDSENSCFTTEDVFDKGICSACDGECNIEWK